MHVLLHLGVHATDQDRLLGCLLNNHDALLAEGVCVPNPIQYRPLIRDTLLRLRNEVPAPDLHEIMLDMILDAVADREQAKRVILSHQGFLGIPGQAIGDGMLYPFATNRIERIAQLFAGSEVSLAMGVCNIATFLPHVFAHSDTAVFEAYLRGTDPVQLNWYNLVRRLKNAVPHLPLTIWANEDTPLIWKRLLQVFTNDAPVTLDGADDFLGSLMRPGALDQMHSYIAAHPPETEPQRQKIIAGFLDKLGLDDIIEPEIDLPGWTDAYVTALTERYEDDLHRIETIPGVTVITP